MKIGIYGGTFNPPHLGHQAAAETAVKVLGLDKLILIPAAVPPHKQMPEHSPENRHRLEMTRKMADAMEMPGIVTVSDMEMNREGKSYTADTLRAVKEQYPDAELWLLMGTDMFLTLHLWRKPDVVLACAGIAAFGRTEEDTEELFAIQREHLQKTFPGCRIFTLTIPGVIEISSTELREKLAKGEGENFLAPAVYGYILKEHLYGTNADLKNLTLDQLRPVALSYLKHKRIPHVLGAEQEAIRLAERYGADVEKARRAALLHDCTKKLLMEDQKALCEHYGIELDEMEQWALKLLHSKTGAAIARDVFGVDDEIYSAIFYHTTGKANMSLLEKVIYLADYIEPTRDFPGVEELRRACYEDLDGGLLLGLEMSVEEMRSMGNPVHPATLEARDALKG